MELKEIEKLKINCSNRTTIFDTKDYIEFDKAKEIIESQQKRIEELEQEIGERSENEFEDYKYQKELEQENTELKAKLKEAEEWTETVVGRYNGVWDLVCGLESKHYHRAFMNKNRFSKQLLPVLAKLKADIKPLTNKNK